MKILLNLLTTIGVIIGFIIIYISSFSDLNPNSTKPVFQLVLGASVIVVTLVLSFFISKKIK